MDTNFNIQNSPFQFSERKDSFGWSAIPVNRINDVFEELPSIDLNCSYHEHNEEMISILNCHLSPQSVLRDSRLKPGARDHKIMFPLLEPNHFRLHSSFDIPQIDDLPTLFQLFQPEKNQEQNDQPVHFDGLSRLGYSIDEKPITNEKIASTTKDNIIGFLKHSELELKTFSEFENNLKSKGLKLLSIIVFDIVTNKKTTTYKEVADLILKDTMSLQMLESSDRKTELTREEQNIKRRVYDVLNVLISADSLIKEGKIVKKNDINNEIIMKNKRAELNSLYSKIVE